MSEILGGFSDDEANRRLPVVGSNSPYAIGHHCVEVARWWLGTVGCGQALLRDRNAEFTSTGSVPELLARVAQTRLDMVAWTGQMLNDGICGRDARGTKADVDLTTVTPEWVVLHVVHDVAQHLGQLEITRDLLRK